MKKLLISTSFLLAAFFSTAQTGVYKTYEDYASGNIEKMEDNVKVTGTSLGLSYHFTTVDGNKVKYKPKNFWGFIFKGNLFRSDGRYTAMLQDSGKVCYYISGEAGVHMLRTGKNYGVTIVGPYCYLSSGDMNACLYGMPRDGLDLAGLKNFKKDYSEFDLLFDCIGKFAYYEEIRKCVADFNKSNKK